MSSMQFYNQSLFRFVRIYLLVGIFTIAGCFSSRHERPSYHFTSKLSLEAIDLSEDRSILSSQNDEIILSYFVCNQDSSPIVRESDRSDLLLFDSTTSKFDLDVSLSTLLNDSNVLVVCLTEIDEDNSEDSVLNQLTRLINESGIGILSNSSHVDAFLGDNDWLGYVNIPSTFKRKLYSVLIQGKQLFDDYKYELLVLYK